MKTKQNVMKNLMLLTAAIAFCIAIVAKTVDVKAASAPSGLKQVQADYSAYSYVKVQWNAVAGASGYFVEYSTSKTDWTKAVSSKSIANTDYQFGSLNAGSTYYVRVRSNASSWSAPIAVNTSPKADPDVKWTGAAAQSATVSWAPVPGANAYVIGLSSDGSNVVIKGYTYNTSVPVNNLPNNGGVYVHVYPARNVENPNFVAYSKYYYDYCDCYTAPSTPKPADVGATKYNYSSAKRNTLTYAWTPTSTSYNTNGYEIEVYRLKSNGKTSRIKKTSTNYYTRNYVDIKSSKLFKYASRYRVRAYVTLDNGAKAYSAWSSYKNYVPQAKIKKLSFPYRKSKTATLKWSKVSGAQSYTIYCAIQSKSPLYKTPKFKKLKTVKGTSATVKADYYKYSCYYVKANKVKFGKKKLSSVAPKKAPYYSYFY